MKRILIIEDEYNEVKIAFEYVKNVLYSGELELTNVIKSQEINFNELCAYDVIFLDITLSKSSKLDGYGILSEIERRGIKYNKIVIMTGNNRISSGLLKRGIKTEYPILTKPISFKEIKKMLE